MRRCKQFDSTLAIGTTSRGIGPCYEDKIGRRGIRIADLFEPDTFRTLYDVLAEDKKTLAATFKLDEPIDYGEIRHGVLRQLAPSDIG